MLSLLFRPCRLSEFTLAEPLIRYGAGIIGWTQKELKDLDTEELKS